MLFYSNILRGNFMQKRLILVFLLFITASFWFQISNCSNNEETTESICNKIKEALFDITKNGNKISYQFKSLTNEAIDTIFNNFNTSINKFIMTIPNLTPPLCNNKKHIPTIPLKTHTEFLKAYYTKHPYVFSEVFVICSLSIAHSVYTLINKAKKSNLN